MKKLLLAALVVLTRQLTLAQLPTSCANMAPICTDAGLGFTAETNSPNASTTDPGNNYDCLISTPNPTWYYLEIATSGSINMSLTAPSDIDFAVWGPFTSLNNAVANCGSYGVPIDCSFSATNNETPSIPNAVIGQVYVMLITNYANNVQNISLTQTGGTGATDCTIINPCQMQGLTSGLSGCFTNPNTYNLTGAVTFIDPPGSGTLVVQSCSGQTQTFNAPFNSPQNYSLSGLTQNGNNCQITAQFSDDNACTISTNFTAPTPITSSVSLNCNNGTATIAINGGLPASNGSNYTASNLSPATASFANTTCSSGGTITINGLTQGDNFTFTVTDNNGCPHNVAGGPFVGQPIANAGNDNTICNSFTTTLNATPSLGSGVWTGPVGVTISNSSSPSTNATVNAAGTYTLTWTETNGNCSDQDDVILTFSNLSFTNSVTQPTCGQNNASINLTANNGIPPYNYSIDNGTTFQGSGTFNNLASGSYNVMITDQALCSTMGIVNINNSANLTIDQIDSTDPLCNGSCNGAITINATGATNYSIDGGTTYQASNTFLNLCSGNYNINISDANGCSAASVVNLTQPPSITSITVENCDGTANTTVNGGLPSIDGSNYTASNLLPASANFSNSSCSAGGIIVVNNLLDGDAFSFTVSDNNGCIHNIVGGPYLAQPIAFAGVNDTVCNSLNYDLNAIPSVGTGIWTGPTGITFSNNLSFSSAVTAASPGLYTLTWTETNGNCTDQDDVTILFTSLTYTENIVPPTCGQNNALLNLTASSGIVPYNYSIDNGTAFQAIGSFNNLAPGSYSVVITDQAFCSASGIVNISSSSSITINQITTVNPGCNGICTGSIAINATNATSFSIDGGATSQQSNNFPNLCSGTYIIRITDNNGCTKDSSISLTEPPALVLNGTGQDLLCNNQCIGQITVDATGGVAPYQFSNNNGASYGTNNVFGNLCAGNHLILARDANNCSTNFTITLSEPPAITLAIQKDDETCFNDCDGWITCNPGGGTSPYQYHWTPTIPNLNQPSLTNLCSGNYSVTVIDANGCSASSNGITITSPALVVIDNLITNPEICENNNNGNATIVSTTANSYSLDNVVFTTNNVFNNLSPGNYIAYVKDVAGCLAQAPFTIAAGQNPSITLPFDTTVCLTATLNIIPNVTGGNPPYSFTWHDGSSAGNLPVTVNGPTTLSVQVIDYLNCPSASASMNINVYSALNVLAFADTTICEGGSAILNATASGGSGVYFFNWSNGLGNGQSQLVSPSNSTTYTVTLDDNCETPNAMANVTVNVNIMPTPQLTADLLESCVPLLTQLTGTQGYINTWTFEDGTVQTGTVITQSFSNPGIYDVTLTLTDNIGCTSEVTNANYFIAHSFPLAQFEWTPEDLSTLQPTVNFVDLSSNATDYLWTISGMGNTISYGEPQPSHTFSDLDSATYLTCLEVKTSFGCRDTICHNIFVNGDDRVFVPNAFTPGPDGLNSIFKPVITGAASEDYLFMVFNRWGDKIFQTNNLNQGWDGHFKGRLSQTDVYIWKIQYKDKAHYKIHELQGHVTLLR